ncbi:MAG: hypothetical protein DME19_20505 [Verrucomicrobia bacterium]|nr:MAG: hypothetical protein DME19_20505 [Verrucomicrobiota bacterium]
MTALSRPPSTIPSGKPDLAVANFNSGNVSVLLGRGEGSFRAAVNYGAGSAPYALGGGDFNGDGKPDLAVANKFSSDISVLLCSCVPPELEIAVAPGNSAVTVSWPSPLSGFVFQSTASLSTTDWQPAAGTMRTNNGRLEATVPLNQSKRYFRLRKQAD